MSSNTNTVCHSSSSSQVEFQPERSFDDQKMRHYLEGQVSVLHCHHYATLFTQLACDAESMDGIRHLTEATTEALQPVLSGYYKKNAVNDISDRISIAEQYWSFIGMGQVKLEFEDKTGHASMSHSHIDEGWIKKWGQRKEPVNFVGQGYIKAAWAAIFDNDPAGCRVTEDKSIVCGDSSSEFTVNW
ncbi:MAG: hypothetical protein GY835_15495 [bacterium]|nr:hypothetical protein [bacterium]